MTDLSDSAKKTELPLADVPLQHDDQLRMATTSNQQGPESKLIIDAEPSASPSSNTGAIVVNRTNYPISTRYRLVVDFSIKLCNVTEGLRVRDMKVELIKRGCKPLAISWFAKQRQCYLHYGNRNGEPNSQEDVNKIVLSVNEFLSTLSSVITSHIVFNAYAKFNTTRPTADSTSVVTTSTNTEYASSSLNNVTDDVHLSKDKNDVSEQSKSFVDLNVLSPLNKGETQKNKEKEDIQNGSVDCNSTPLDQLVNHPTTSVDGINHNLSKLNLNEDPSSETEVFQTITKLSSAY